MEQKSVLEDLGEEVTGIMAPVSICMAITVLLVRVLNPEGQSSSATVYIASLAYDEQASRAALVCQGCQMLQQASSRTAAESSVTAKDMTSLATATGAWRSSFHQGCACNTKM